MKTPPVPPAPPTRLVPVAAVDAYVRSFNEAQSQLTAALETFAKAQGVLVLAKESLAANANALLASLREAPKEGQA